MEVQAWVALAGLIVTVFGGLAGVFAYFQGRLTVLTDKGAGDLAALRDDLKTDIERVRSQEAQLRDRLSVEWQKSVTDIDSEQRRIRDGSATRVEMAAMEGRINGSIGKLEARIDRIDTKLESLPAMHAIMTTLVASVDRLSVAAGVRKPAP